MKKMKSSIVHSTLIISLLSISAHADETQTQVAPWLKVNGEVNFELTGKDSTNYEKSLRTESVLKFEVLLHEGIKFYLKTQLRELLMKDGVGVSPAKFDIENFINEAYIEIQTDKFGLPKAVITAGKQTMAFGNWYSEVPMFKDNLLFKLVNEKEVIGLTVALPVNFFGIVDKVAMSLFEAGVGDLDIADQKGASIKLSKQLTKQLQAEISAMTIEQANKDNENRGSIGVVFTSEDGSTKIWAEGLVFDNKVGMLSTDFGGMIGASRKLGPGTVVIEYEYLQKVSHELVVAYNLPVGEGLIISPELRRTMSLNGGVDDTRIGIKARILFQKEVNHNLLTGSKTQ